MGIEVPTQLRLEHGDRDGSGQHGGSGSRSNAGIEAVEEADEDGGSTFTRRARKLWL